MPVCNVSLRGRGKIGAAALADHIRVMTLQTTLTVRPYEPRDADAVWPILAPVIEAGETYPVPRDMTCEGALAWWAGPDRETFVAKEAGAIVGTYYLKANQGGGGSHVANCGYMTAAHAIGHGVGRRMCLDSIDRARERGFRAMQFNCVVSTEERTVRIWNRLGFDIVGRLPLAFHHPVHGYVDALVMFRPL